MGPLERIGCSLLLAYFACQNVLVSSGQEISSEGNEHECGYWSLNGASCSGEFTGEYYEETDFQDESDGDDSSESDDGPIEIPDFVQDQMEECTTWAFEDRRCNEDPHFMLKNCPRSCLQQEDLLEYTHFVFTGDNNGVSDDCLDNNEEECPDWADEGFCYSDDKWMLENCKKSCHVCFSPNETIHFKIGERQIIDNFDVWEGALEKMAQSVDYIKDVVMSEPIYAPIRRSCLNNNAECFQWAAEGRCENEYEYMQINCAPACRTCEKVDERIRCPVPEGLEKPALQPGDLDKMFERIVKQDTYKVNILSQPSSDGRQRDGPWVITLDNFLTSEECDRLIVLGYDERYERSTEVTSNNDGTVESKAVTRARTSTTAWCEKPECYQDPIVQNILDKISIVLDIPDAYGEHLQLLKYEEGQFYKRHHDYISSDKFANYGPRILTFFLYLNTPKDGGGTRFNDLEIDVQPQRGMAVLWPSVFNDDPSEKDHRTEHEALSVIKGIKYGANAWYHLRNVKDMPDCH